MWVVRAPHPDGEPGAAVAFAIGRPVGSAVVRNRLRRRLRELMAARVDRLDGLYLVGARAEAAELDFPGLGEQLDTALESLR